MGQAAIRAGNAREAEMQHRRARPSPSWPTKTACFPGNSVAAGQAILPLTDRCVIAGRQLSDPPPVLKTGGAEIAFTVLGIPVLWVSTPESQSQDILFQRKPVDFENDFAATQRPMVTSREITAQSSGRRLPPIAVERSTMVSSASPEISQVK
jgi:hypothetical protein